MAILDLGLDHRQRGSQDFRVRHQHLPDRVTRLDRLKSIDEQLRQHAGLVTTDIGRDHFGLAHQRWSRNWDPSGLRKAAVDNSGPSSGIPTLRRATWNICEIWSAKIPSPRMRDPKRGSLSLPPRMARMRFNTFVLFSGNVLFQPLFKNRRHGQRQPQDFRARPPGAGGFGGGQDRRDLVIVQGGMTGATSTPTGTPALAKASTAASRILGEAARGSSLRANSLSSELMER
jgi:hypothetical protein